MVMQSKQKAFPQTVLSPNLAKIWSFVPIRYLILATPGYIVFIDDALEVDWKSTPEWDEVQLENREKFAAILNRAAEIESGDCDDSDEQKTLHWKRQIGEAIARGLDGDFTNAEKMLEKADSYRANMLNVARRRAAIGEQVQIKDGWKAYFRRWTALHYGIGVTALLMSTLVASKPIWMGLGENQISFCAWLVAALTGLLTFLTPDKKADKYNRAWSMLNSEITRYNTNDAYTVEDVLDAYQQGESIIHESPRSERRRSRPRA
jgi:hypothetical protein